MGVVALRDRLLALASEASPLVRENLDRHGDAPVADVLRSLRSEPVEALQPRDGLWEVVHEQAAAHYGEELARDAVAELRTSLQVPTSNHFGVDTFADSVQGTLLYALRPGMPAGGRRTAVVLGFGSISANNLTYPMGLRLYDPANGGGEVPQRLPVLPNRVKHCAVNTVGPFDREMVGRARRRLRTMHRNGEVSAFCERAAGEILDEDFADAGTLALASYGRQATRVNASMWRRLFRDAAAAPRLVQLQIEPICAALLASDLFDPASLAHTLLFSAPVRDRLLRRLDGASGCWRLAELRRRLHGSAEDGHHPCGTVFFWGLSEQGRRVPLTLDGDGGSVRLTGVDERRRRWGWDLTPDGLAPAVREGRLLPSLFTCFAVLAFARGLACVGGYYQVEYLPVMQRGAVEALMAGGHRLAAGRVARVPTELCLAGLQCIVRVLPGGAVVPAGPVEIAGAGGLTEADLAGIGTVTVRDAHLVAFTELFHHLAPRAALPDGWARTLAAENGARSGHLVRL